MKKSGIFFLGLFLVLGLFGQVFECPDFTLTESNKWVNLGEPFDVSPENMYRISFSIKGDAPNARIIMQFFGQDGALIRPFWLNAVTNTETELSEECSGGSTTVIVNDASKWLPPKQAPIIVFNAKSDLSDLPNKNIHYYIKSIAKNDDGRWTLTFDRPLRKYPKGTIIRQHKDGGSMQFGVNNVPISKNWGDVTLYALPATTSGAPHNGMWRGAVKGQLKVFAANVVNFRNVKLEKVSADEKDALLSKRALRGKDARNAISIGGGIKPLPSKDALECIFPGDTMAFYQQGLDWNMEDIRQIDVEFMSETPGYVSFTIVAEHNGKRSSMGEGPFSVIPDGEYHHYVYDVSNSKTRFGKVTNWELRFRGDPGKVGVKSIITTGIQNRVPDPTTLEPGKERELAPLMPRARCSFSWEGGSSAGASLRFYDSNMKEIQESAVRLAPGEKQVEFTTPEMLITSKIILDAKGDGTPVVRQLFYQKPYSAANLQWHGKWIWSRLEEGPDFWSVWFRKVINLDEAPQYACMAVEGDDRAYLYINGRFVGKTPAWKIAHHYDITRFLKPGRNEVCVRVLNDNQKSGLVGDIYIQTSKGEQYICTDDSWECDAKSNMDTGIPKEYPTKAVILGDPATLQPWAQGMGYAYAGPTGVFNLIKAEPGKMTVLVERMPAVSKNRLKFKMVKENGSISLFEMNVTPGSEKWLLGEECVITYPIPRVESSGFKLYLNDDFITIKDGKPIMEAAKVDRKPTALRQARLLQNNGRPRLMLGEQELNPAFWEVATSIKVNHDPEWEIAIERGCHNFRVCTGLESFWLGNGKYDFTAFDDVMDRMLSFSPQGTCSILMGMDMPEWWLKLNPDDTAKHCNGGPRRYLEHDDQAIGSQRWLDDAAIALKAFIDHIKTRSYAGQVWGVSFGVSANSEWFWNLTDDKGKLDWAGYSKSDLEKFRRCLKEKYKTDQALAKAWHKPGMSFDKVTLPHFDKACKGTVGILFDPTRDQMVMDWLWSRTRSMSDALIAFGKCIKENTDGKWLVGAYYGYTCEFATSSSPQLIGHNGYYDAACSPYVDFVHAPSRYLNRKSGLCEQSMHTIDTWLFHGKMTYAEMDCRTAYCPVEVGLNKLYSGAPDTALQSVGQIHRSFGMMLATGTLNYWYDITRGAFYEKAMSMLTKEQADVRKALPAVQGTTPVEIAVVFDRDSVYYAKVGGADTLWYASHYGIFRYFQCNAVPFHNMSKQDLLDNSIKVPAHKLYIMLPTLVLTKQERSELMARFEKEGATVLWLYSAGPFYPGNGPSPSNCCDFLGIKTKMLTEKWQPAMKTTAEYGSVECVNYNATAPWFIPVSGFDKVIGSDAKGQPLMVSKRIGKATHIFTTLCNLPVPFYAALLPKSGVHRYTTSIADPCWVGNDVIFLYAKTSGEKSFNLPAGCRAEAILGPFRGTLRSGETFNAVSGLTYGFLIRK